MLIRISSFTDPSYDEVDSGSGPGRTRIRSDPGVSIGSGSGSDSFSSFSKGLDPDMVLVEGLGINAIICNCKTESI